MKNTITLDESATLLLNGGVGILPTDTVYGLVARARDTAAVDMLYTLKPREFKPGTLIAASVDQLVDLGFKRRYISVIEQYWPGPVSVVIPAGPELAYMHLGKGSFPVRIPNTPELVELLHQTGPLLTTSANHPDEPTATTITEAQAVFGNRVAFYVDGGDLSGRAPSTILRVVDDAVEVLREGAVKINEQGTVA